MRNLDQLWEDVSLAVCRVCVDFANGHCGLSDPNRCALKAHFKNVVDAIASVNEDSYPPYVFALRDRVCTTCEHRLPSGGCTTRDNVDCALDRYYPLVIETIENSLRGALA